MVELSPSVSRELLQALADADLITRCLHCVKHDGLCESCLEREGPKLAQPDIWFRLMGKREGGGCPKCGSELRVEAPDDGSMWLHCIGGGCNYWMRVQTREEREAQERYEAKAEKRAQALARATAGRRASRGKELTERHRIPIRRVA